MNQSIVVKNDFNKIVEKVNSVSEWLKITNESKNFKPMFYECVLGHLVLMNCYLHNTVFGGDF